MADNLKIRVTKRCPVCNWRVMDKVTPTTGIIEMKCPNCKKVIEIDLSFRKNVVKYRLAAVR